jgi:hypothetical protein
MTMTFKIQAGDLGIVNGKLVKVASAFEVEQRIIITLNHFWGEYFLNVPGGVPWFELILGGKDVKLYEAILRKIILAVPGVTSILKFSSSFQNRRFALALTVDAVWSTASGIITTSYTRS